MHVFLFFKKGVDDFEIAQEQWTMEPSGHRYELARCEKKSSISFATLRTLLVVWFISIELPIDVKTRKMFCDFKLKDPTNALAFNRNKRTRAIQ